MSQQGWISIHRKILESNICPKGKFSRFEAWIFILLQANHQDGLWQGIVVKRGSFITSQVKLSDSLGWALGTVNLFLNWLKTESRIEIKTTNKYTVISVINYDTYQRNESKNENEMKASRKQTETNNKENKENKILPKGNMANADSRNKEINLIIESYKKNMGFNPTDKLSPRYVAQVLRTNIYTFLKNIKSKRPDLTFDSTLNKTWEWFLKRDDLKGNTLDSFRRKAKMLFDLTLKKEEVIFK